MEENIPQALVSAVFALANNDYPGLASVGVHEGRLWSTDGHMAILTAPVDTLMDAKRCAAFTPPAAGVPVGGKRAKMAASMAGNDLTIGAHTLHAHSTPMPDIGNLLPDGGMRATVPMKGAFPLLDVKYMHLAITLCKRLGVEHFDMRQQSGRLGNMLGPKYIPLLDDAMIILMPMRRD